MGLERKKGIHSRTAVGQKKARVSFEAKKKTSAFVPLPSSGYFISRGKLATKNTQTNTVNCKKNKKRLTSEP